jgi:hypothetical protein
MGWDEKGRYIALGDGTKLYTWLRDTSEAYRRLGGQVVAFTRHTPPPPAAEGDADVAGLTRRGN